MKKSSLRVHSSRQHMHQNGQTSDIALHEQEARSSQPSLALPAREEGVQDTHRVLAVLAVMHNSQERCGPRI